MIKAKTIGRWRLTLAAASLAMVAQPLQAAPQYCDGKIQEMFHDHLGVVYVYPTFRSNWIAICNVNASWNGITPELCKAWISEVLSIILADKPVTMYYNHIDVASCATIPAYANAPAPGYIMVRK